ncbi:MAG: class I SAM-dependent methyltransferase [Xanthomonadales bacterium]|nr:class I SAM-dependent methyltransferase [Xanthomonadales bacterium]
MTDLWTRYYQAGDVHSSTAGFSTDARERIADRWKKRFSELPDGATILDIGSGGGALLEFAAKTAGPERSLKATAVDLSTTRPDDAPASTDHFAIEFQGGIEFTNLPFDANVFSLVASQFAIEYGNLPEALAEAARVSSGGLMALIHARDGVIVRQNAPIAEQVDWLLDELRLVEVLTHHVQRPTPASGNQLKLIGSEIGTKVDQLENPSFLRDLAGNIGQFLSGYQENPTQENIRLLRGFERALKNHRDRMRALAVAGRTPEEMDKACAQLLEAGFKDARWEAQRSDGDRHLVGYWLHAAGKDS